MNLGTVTFRVDTDELQRLLAEARGEIERLRAEVARHEAAWEDHRAAYPSCFWTAEDIAAAKIEGAALHAKIFDECQHPWAKVVENPAGRYEICTACGAEMIGEDE